MTARTKAKKHGLDEMINTDTVGTSHKKEYFGSGNIINIFLYLFTPFV